MRLYAENNTNYIRSLDTGSEIKLQVINNDNSPVNLTTLKSTTVIIGQDNIGRLAGITPHYIDEFGFLKFKFNKNNSLNAGRYYLEVHMQTTEDQLMISPTRNKFIMEVEYSIDELGNQVAVMAVQELLDNIQSVKDTVKATEEYAKETLEKANEALSGVESANQNATEALSKATNAENQSTTALSNSTDALTKATTAETNSSIALTKSTTAEANSSEALNKATEALSTANNAIDKSTIAETNSTESLAKSNEALDTANSTILKSDVAITNSTIAKNDSEQALNKAEESLIISARAEDISNTSITTSNTAKKIADAVRSEFDQLVLESGSTDAEVIQARTNINNEVFPNLKSRLDSMEESETTIDGVTGLQDVLNQLTSEDSKVVFGNEIHGLRINSTGNLEYLNTTNSTWIEIKSGISGNVKLANYPYVLMATVDNQKKFTIPLSTFDKDNDYLLVVQNSTVLSNDKYKVVDRIITLNEGVKSNTSLFISILKNVIVGDGNIVEGNVRSVAGRTGDVLLTTSDVSEVEGKFYVTETEKDSLVQLSENLNDITESTQNKIDTVKNIAESKYTKLETGIPVSDLSDDLQAKLGSISTKTELDTLNQTVITHNENVNNPHNVTATQVGAMPLTGGALTGITTAFSNTSYTVAQLRNVTISTNIPTSSDGSNGDIWIKY